MRGPMLVLVVKGTSKYLRAVIAETVEVRPTPGQGKNAHVKHGWLCKTVIMVTVGAVLADKELSLVPVFLPHPDIEVRWVATSELPDPAPFFEGGEILLTTGLQTADWDREWDGYVRSLVDAGIVGIGIGTGLTFASPPTGLVAACRSNDVNLFEVPHGIPFVAISHRTSQMLAAQREEAARRALSYQRKLTAAAATPNAELAVMEALARILEGAVAILGADGHVVLGAVGERRAELDQAALGPEVVRLRDRGSRSATTLSDATGTTVLQPLGVSGRSSFLAATGPSRLSDAQRSAITTAVALLGLIEEQARSAAATRRRLRSRAVELALAGDARTSQLLLDVEPGAPEIPKELRIVLAAGETESLTAAVESLAEAQVIAAEHNDRLCAIAPAEQAVTLSSELAGNGLLVGVGNTAGAAEAGVSYRTAALALAQATPAIPVITWDRVVAQGPLGLIDPQGARAFATGFLGGLDEDQLDTLRCFLRHHGSRLKVAEELGLHRNTVRNRLDAIEAGLPGSLDDPQTRVSAWIALQSLPERAR